METDAARPYDTLLQGVRAVSTGVLRRTLEEEADSDRGRVLFSAPLRRLQNKAQVFSLEGNAAVRSRLTHSLEVSSIGRYIAQQVLKEFASRQQLETVGLSGKERPFISFVETACLLHDIGNPPFGHFGERAIGEWFRIKKEAFSKSPDLSQLGDVARHEWEDHYADLTNCDGNPQGFRIMARLHQDRERPRGENRGANLTLTQLAACIKYPRSCLAASREGGGAKGGYFLTETGLVTVIRAKLGLDEDQRHPLVYLMEAADDIAYCLSDLEDGVEKGIVIPQDLAQLLKVDLEHIECQDTETEGEELRKVRQALDSIIDRDSRGKMFEIFWNFRSSVIRLLVMRTARIYVDRHADIINRSGVALLRSQEPEKSLLGRLKAYAMENLYSSKLVRSREITAFRVLHGLLDAHFPLMCCNSERFDAAMSGRVADEHEVGITIESSLASRLPQKYVAMYRIALAERDGFEATKVVREWSLRAHLILDYISGMTDEYALRTYQLVSGVRVDISD